MAFQNCIAALFVGEGLNVFSSRRQHQAGSVSCAASPNMTIFSHLSLRVLSWRKSPQIIIIRLQPTTGA